MLGLHAPFDWFTSKACLGRGLQDRVGPSRARAAWRPAVEPLDARLLLSGVPTPDHVVVVMEENHAYSEIIGSANAPYINTLAGRAAVFTKSFAITHPSEPNYLDIFSGANQGITDDSAVTQPFATPNLGASLIQAGLTFGGYAEGLPSVGSTAISSGNYVARHNPYVDWQGAPANAIPAADNQPFTAFPSDFSTLPTVSFVIPNLQDDMHDGSIAMGDTWLKANLDSYVQWAQTHNSLLIVTFDEDDSSESNQVLTLFAGPMVVPGSYSESINHFSVLRTVEDMYGLPYAGASATATPITDVWRATVAPQLGVSAPSSPTAGAAFSITVTARDATGNTAANYLGTVHFTSSDAQAVLPADYTFTAADAGVHTFEGAILKTAGPQSITATDKATPSLTGTQPGITVAPADASHLVISGPATVTVGTPFSITVTASIPMATGQPATSGRSISPGPNPTPMSSSGKPCCLPTIASRPATPGCISSPTRRSSRPRAHRASRPPIPCRQASPPHWRASGSSVVVRASNTTLRTVHSRRS